MEVLRELPWGVCAPLCWSPSSISCPTISQAELLSLLLPFFLFLILLSLPFQLVISLGVCKTLCSQRAYLPMADAPVFRHGPSRVDIAVTSLPKGPRSLGIHRSSLALLRVPRLCLLVAPVSKPDWLCPHRPTLPSVLASWMWESSSLPFPLPPSSRCSVWLLWVWPYGPAMEGGSFLPESRLQELCFKVCSTDIPQSRGMARAQCSGCLAHPLPRRKERKRNRKGER